MKKRLYNKYGAAYGDDVTDIQRIMQDATNLVTKYCIDNNLDLRDALSICKSEVDIMFAPVVIREGIRIKKQEQTDALTARYQEEQKMSITEEGEKAVNEALDNFRTQIYK